jgi:lysophospholipase L1-like esterase
VARRAARLTTFAVAALLPAIAVAAPAGADDPTPQCTKLAVIGDSLTYGSAKLLTAELTSRAITDFAVDAERGRMIRSKALKSGVRALQELRKKGYTPDCFVVALGTNDIGLTGDQDKFKTWIDEMMTEIGDHPVLWVNVARPKPTGRAIWFNAVLGERQTHWPNLLIGDWSAVLAPHPEWIAFDKIHLKKAGYAARATWLASEVLNRLYIAAPTLDLPDCSIAHRLHQGSKGPEVTCLETRLEQLGFPMPGGPDEKFDKVTYQAVARFQKWHWLPPNGATGPATVDALGLTPA